MHRCSESNGPVLKREERDLEFAARLFARHAREAPRITPPGDESRAVRLARDFLDHRLEDNVRLAEVAAAAGVPPFRLFRAFLRATGMSPHAYQRQARIRFATGLLRLGHPLSGVAAAAGFADQAHLTLTFRRMMAVTPGAYRVAVRRSQ